MLLSLGGKDAGYLYECNFDIEAPLKAIPMAGTSGAAVTARCLTHDAQHMLLGAADGSVRVHLADQVTSSFLLNMHDNGAAITAITLGFDGAHVLSGGADGVIFVYSAGFQEEGKAVTPREGAVITPFPAGPGEPPVDIDDPTAYTLEESQQKAEQDRMARTAEERKMDARREISRLRKECVALRTCSL